MSTITEQPAAQDPGDGSHAVQWPSGDDHQAVINAIKDYVRTHPGCTEAEVIKALGLPDMTGIPVPAARTSAQWKAAGRARDALQHVRYCIRTYGPQAGAGSTT